jgi:hypothetical protein
MCNVLVLIFRTGERKRKEGRKEGRKGGRKERRKSSM